MKKMMPIGPLMIEHRLIERMIKVMERELLRIEDTGKGDPGAVDTLVDFFTTYADRCHHGKEEDILFRDLRKKSISAEHEKIMNDLIADHEFGRTTTKKMADANVACAGGDEKSVSIVIDCMKSLLGLYPPHIEKEDRHFFLPVMKYFTKEEQDVMLEEEYEFDMNMIHEHYRSIVLKAEERAKM
ncbi:MAG: hemerythrin domain-containing protein [Nitrospirota bacterium]